MFVTSYQCLIKTMGGSGESELRGPIMDNLLFIESLFITNLKYKRIGCLNLSSTYTSIKYSV